MPRPTSVPSKGLDIRELCGAVLGHRFEVPTVPTHRVFREMDGMPLYDDFMAVCRHCGFLRCFRCKPGQVPTAEEVHRG